MSAVAALAVASPFAISALTDMTKPAPQEREFRKAAMITDLPNELMSALSQGLSQFGINLPPMPTSLLTGTGSAPTTLTAPGALTSPGLMPGLTPPGSLGASPLATPGLGTDPAAAVPTLSPDALANPSLTNPLPPVAGTNPALTGQLPGANPALTSPTGAAPGGLTTQPVAGLDPALATTPISNGVGLPAPGEVPISAPIGLDPAAGTYPILGGDPGLGTLPASTAGSGGLLGDLSSAAQQLGAGQAIDLLKGVVMPMITSAMKPPIPPAPAPDPVPPAPAG